MTKQFYNNIILIQSLGLNYERERVNATRRVLVYSNFLLKRLFDDAFLIFQIYV